MFFLVFIRICLLVCFPVSSSHHPQWPSEENKPHTRVRTVNKKCNPSHSISAAHCTFADNQMMKGFDHKLFKVYLYTEMISATPETSRVVNRVRSSGSLMNSETLGCQKWHHKPQTQIHLFPQGLGRREEGGMKGLEIEVSWWRSEVIGLLLCQVCFSHKPTHRLPFHSSVRREKWQGQTLEPAWRESSHTSQGGVKVLYQTSWI